MRMSTTARWGRPCRDTHSRACGAEAASAQVKPASSSAGRSTRRMSASSSTQRITGKTAPSASAASSRCSTAVPLRERLRYRLTVETAMEEGDTDGGLARVLIVDDEPDIRLVVRLGLEAAGLLVAAAG